MNTKHLLLGSLLASSIAVPALAQQNTVKIGVSHVQPRSSTSNFSGPFTPTGISLIVRDKTTPFFSYTRDIDEQWAVELAVGFPPTHDIELTVNNLALPASAQALSGQVGAKVRQVAPTLFLNYRFLEKTSPLRPFVGVGINYTRFDKTSSNAVGNALNGGPTSIALEDSAGLALQGGVSYRLSDQWSLTAALATAQVKSRITTNTLGIERTADIKFRPSVFTVALGYSF